MLDTSLWSNVIHASHGSVLQWNNAIIQDGTNSLAPQFIAYMQDHFNAATAWNIIWMTFEVIPGIKPQTNQYLAVVLAFGFLGSGTSRMQFRTLISALWPCLVFTGCASMPEDFEQEPSSAWHRPETTSLGAFFNARQPEGTGLSGVESGA